MYRYKIYRGINKKIFEERVVSAMQYSATDSRYLCEYFSRYFDIWWDPDKFNWKEASHYLCYYCRNYFDDWWDPDKFDWEKGSRYLCECHSDYFNNWWDSDKFNWEDASYALCKYCHKYFDIWWDSNKFNWKRSEYLLDNCLEHFDKWWDSEKFIWDNCIYMDFNRIAERILGNDAIKNIEKVREFFEGLSKFVDIAEMIVNKIIQKQNELQVRTKQRILI